jgi:hypothetical protein
MGGLIDLEYAQGCKRLSDAGYGVEEFFLKETENEIGLS